MDVDAWRTWVSKEVRSHAATWAPIYLVGNELMRGNFGAHHRGRIFLNKNLEGRIDPEVFEVLHHEIFHLKIERARLLNTKVGRMRMDEATTMAGKVADKAFAPGLRSALINHYHHTAGAGFDEECLVQMCCAQLFEEPVDMPPRLHAICEALCAPYSRRVRFWGGFIGSLPSCLQGVQRWPEEKPLPGEELPEAPVLGSKYRLAKELSHR